MPERQSNGSAVAKIWGDRHDIVVPSLQSPDNRHVITPPRVQALEKQVLKLQRERDDLAKEVELLWPPSCSIFDSSMVLDERVYSAEKALSRTRAQLFELTVERDDLIDDLKGHRDSKCQAFKSWRAEHARAEKLEEEVQFYQAQCAIAFADRDKTSWELEEIRKTARRLEFSVREAETAVQSSATVQSELEGQLEEARSRIVVLNREIKDCGSIPGLRKQIENNTKQIANFEAAQEGLQRNLDRARIDHQEARMHAQCARQRLAAGQKELEENQTAASADQKRAALTILNLESQKADLERHRDILEAKMEEADGNLAAAQVEVENMDAELRMRIQQLTAERTDSLAAAEAAHHDAEGRLESELASAQIELSRVKAEFEQASTEKVQALMRVSQAEQTVEQTLRETNSWLDSVAVLKTKVHEATQEKVAAVIQIADLKERLRNIEEETAFGFTAYLSSSQNIREKDTEGGC